eukprot:Clim_evm130s149 gene=Clim_evmTU130s149
MDIEDAMEVGEPAGTSPSADEGYDVEDIDFDIIENNIDLETLATSYTGNIRIQHLLYVAGRSSPLRQSALELVEHYIKEDTWNTQLYREVAEQLKQMDSNFQPNYHWAEDIDQQAAQQKDRLEADLKLHKDSHIKESIRLGQHDLATFFYKKGELQNANRHYHRTRDYCTNSRYMLQMCMDIVQVDVELGSWKSIPQFVQKAETFAEYAQEPKIQAKLNCAAALASLHAGNYEGCAMSLLKVPYDQVNNITSIMSGADVATHTALCALATFDLQRLKRNVYENAQFSSFLEFAPEMRSILSGFVNSKYAECLSLLERHRNDYLLNMHLSAHIDKLCTEIRTLSMVQYFSPFVSVNLATMARNFNTDLDGLEKELIKLIMNDAIEARIDSDRKILQKRVVNEQQATFQKALRVGEEYGRNVTALLLRTALIKEGLVIGNKSTGN